MRPLAPLLLIAATSCAATPRAPARPQPVGVAAPRDTAEIARDVVHGRVGALFHLDRFRDHPGATKITRLGGWGAMLADTSVDPLDDVTRAFVTAPTSNAHERVLVLEHHASHERVVDTLVRIAARSPGPRRLDAGLGFPSVRTSIEGRECLVAAPRAGLIVVLPEESAGEAARFVAAGGLPEPIGFEAARFFAFEPGSTLEKGPHVPDSIAAAQASLVLGYGGAEISLEGESSSPEQAARDAELLTKLVEEAITLDLILFRMELFDPVRFRAEGARVRTDVRLAPTDVDWLLGVATGPI